MKKEETHEKLVQKNKALREELGFIKARLDEEPLNAARCASLERMHREILGAHTTSACHAIANAALDPDKEEK